MKILLLDLDGTVTNSLNLIKRTFRKVFENMSISWQDEAVMNYIGIPLKEIGRIFAGEARVEEFFIMYQGLYKLEHDLFMECYPGAVETIIAAKNNGYKVGIVTSKSRRGTMLSLDFLKLTEILDYIITADDVMEHKPHPAPVIAALKAFNAKPSQAVFVGDSPFDIIAGKAANVLTIGVTWGMAQREALLEHKPDYLVDSWQELEILLLNDSLFG